MPLAELLATRFESVSFLSTHHRTAAACIVAGRSYTSRPPSCRDRAGQVRHRSHEPLTELTWSLSESVPNKETCPCGWALHCMVATCRMNIVQDEWLLLPTSFESHSYRIRSGLVLNLDVAHVKLHRRFEVQAPP